MNVLRFEYFYFPVLSDRWRWKCCKSSGFRKLDSEDLRKIVKNRVHIHPGKVKNIPGTESYPAWPEKPYRSRRSITRSPVFGGGGYPWSWLGYPSPSSTETGPVTGLGGTPSPEGRTWDQRLGYPPPVNRQTNKLKILPSRRTTYAGDKNPGILQNLIRILGKLHETWKDISKGRL